MSVPTTNRLAHVSQLDTYKTYLGAYNIYGYVDLLSVVSKSPR